MDSPKEADTDTNDLPLHRPSVILTSFDIYESRTELCIIGSNDTTDYHRVLRIDRTAESLDQMAKDDGQSYSAQELPAVIHNLQQSTGMRPIVQNVSGILGFVRFTKGLYISIVTHTKPVALLGGHLIHHIEDTRLLSITYRPERTEREDRFIATFKNVDLSKNFYFSHTYDVTRTLQQNLSGNQCHGCYNGMFVWNYQMLINASVGLRVCAEWTVALVHGYIDQSKLSVLGRDVFVTLVARRSRIFAGVRYLKRGVNDAGFVANDVETEQIVNTMETTGFTTSYTAYVQHRGSIPLFWSQETSGITPKPPIEINVRDPYFVEAGRHFSSLFVRYGSPVIVLNLIKTKERAKRESALGEEFSEGLHYLNQFLPRGRKIRYLAWDMSRAKKNRQEDVLAILEVIAEETLSLTGFFHNGPELYSNRVRRQAAGDASPRRVCVMRQCGVVRSNCIDCLDRTNAAQSIIGKVALAHQLFELGIIAHPHLSFNTDAAMIIEEMYHDLGNTIALQYGGSHLVNTVQTYRRNTNWRSHSRDIVESLRRYYSNSLLDVERQEAITYFVEKTIFPECVLDTKCAAAAGRPYQVGKPVVFRKWWTTLGGPEDKDSVDDRELATAAASTDAYWDEYYRPHTYTSLDSLFVNNLNSSASLHPHTNVQNMPSPFADRSQHQHHSLTASAASGSTSTSTGSGGPPNTLRFMPQEPKWLKSESEEYTDPTGISRQDIYQRVCAKTVTPVVVRPLGVGGWLTDGITTPLQEPQVSQGELKEYEKYVHQFDNLQKWIVQPSNVLYKDYKRGATALKQQQLPLPSMPAMPPSPVVIATAGLGGAEDRQRSQTPMPQKKISSWMLSPAGKEGSMGRARSNTTMLWGLWSQQQQQQQPVDKRTSVVADPAGDTRGSLRTPADVSKAHRVSRVRHDRTRSLDLKVDVDQLAKDDMGEGMGGGSAIVVAEPRVTEADLRVYQDYVKMRKAFGGQ
ncbi:phosphatidylinositol-3,5-bisphosphate 5-phosphatase [Kickxella alabastrina]|uniref:Phosphatidylinositol-3,5-bisphosphate 5-phosphatase n=1 Tax=Kickxella alabastrina TaxID=61397 RepID=A0ACC1IF55_9FUNG|nr:phosphatidylinositol-3,5-bisphosphate 5-phosphatase [Kickxella alabastrina]